MLNSKYIVLDDESGPLNMIIFPSNLNHKDVFNVFKSMNSNNICLSAGFVHPISECNKEPYTYGRSQSLNLESNPEIDDILLQNLLFERN